MSVGVVLMFVVFVDFLFLVCVLPDSIVHVNELLRKSVSCCFVCSLSSYCVISFRVDVVCRRAVAKQN